MEGKVKALLQRSCVSAGQRHCFYAKSPSRLLILPDKETPTSVPIHELSLELVNYMYI